MVAPVKIAALPERLRDGKSLEISLHHHTLRVVCAKSRMNAESLIQGVNDLDLNRLIVGPGRPSGHEHRCHGPDCR